MFTKSPLNVPKLRFKGFEGEWTLKKLLNVCEKNNNSKISSNYFLDAPAIMNKKYSKYNEEKFKQGFEDSIIFIKDGSNSGEFFYSHYDSKIATTCEQIYTNQHNNFIFYMLDKNKTNIKKKLLIGETIPHLYKKNLVNLSFYFPSIHEQQKIAKFFSLLDKQIELWNTKLQLNELIKKYYSNFIYKKYKNKNAFIKFSDLFLEYKLLNFNEESKQCNIGKFGINIIDKTIYSLKKHKNIIKNSLIIGLGIDDLCVNVDIDNICCSSIYKTYFSKTPYLHYIQNVLFNFLKYKKSFFTKKTSRRDYEIIPNLLENMFIPTLDVEIAFYDSFLEKLKKNIDILNTIILFYEKQKKYYLNKIFI